MSFSVYLRLQTAVLWIPCCFPDCSQWLLYSSQLKLNTLLSHFTTVIFTCRSIPLCCAVLHECRGFRCVRLVGDPRTAGAATEECSCYIIAMLVFEMRVMLSVTSFKLQGGKILIRFFKNSCSILVVKIMSALLRRFSSIKPEVRSTF